MERGFASGVLHTLCCTSTLAAGINLPARRCVIRQGDGKLAVGRAQYLQMIGRAGRAGKCPVGEAFLVCEWSVTGKPEDARKNTASLAASRKLLAAPMPRLQSTLLPMGWATASAERHKCATCSCLAKCASCSFWSSLASIADLPGTCLLHPNWHAIGHHLCCVCRHDLIANVS